MRKSVQVTIVVLLAVAALVFDWSFAVRHGFFDLNVYYGAVNYWADGGEIYDFVRVRSTYGFTYPPFGALTMLPMAFISWPVAAVIGSVATVAVTVWLLRALLAPMIRQRRWTPWFVLAVALCLVAAYEPMRETFLFGQVNMLLMGLVAGDLLLLAARRSGFAGVGIGLATAIKLTPGIFIVYLLITKRWREALTAGATAAAATLFAAAVAPDASREFWTSAIWETERVGALSFISNQSLRGVVARLDPPHTYTALWLLLVLGVLLAWFVRCRRAAATGDEVLGLAVTGVIMVLISPVAWIHHLVWAIPAFVLLIERAKPGLVAFAIFGYVVLSSRGVWRYEKDFGGLEGFLFSNAYVWISLALLLLTPATGGRSPEVSSGEVAGARNSAPAR